MSDDTPLRPQQVGLVRLSDGVYHAMRATNFKESAGGSLRLLCHLLKGEAAEILLLKILAKRWHSPILALHGKLHK